MYAGHFASALVLKTARPEAPTWGLLVGVGLLDLLFGPFVLLGIERVLLTPGISPGFSLVFIDWSHSLAMALVWSLAYAAAFATRGRAVALVMGLAVFSHFVLDWPMHPQDLALWPHAETHLGLGIWERLPSGWWFLELAFIAAAWAWYAHRAKVTAAFGGRAVGVGIVLLVLHIANSPWLSAF